MIDFHLCFITDRRQAGARSLEDVVGAACAAGVRAIQLREKDLETHALYDLAVKLRVATARSRAKLVINDRLDVALAVDADGVHCPEKGMPLRIARRLLDRGATLSASVHSIDGALRAEAAEVDFITFGPVFNTPSKARYGKPLGVDALATVCSAVRLPVFAVGGVTPENAGECIRHGAHGVALISALMAAVNIERAVSAFRTSLGGL